MVWEAEVGGGEGNRLEPGLHMPVEDISQLNPSASCLHSCCLFAYSAVLPLKEDSPQVLSQPDYPDSPEGGP